MTTPKRTNSEIINSDLPPKNTDQLGTNTKSKVVETADGDTVRILRNTHGATTEIILESGETIKAHIVH